MFATVILASGAAFVGPTLPLWVHMWAIAVALFFGAKGVTVMRLMAAGMSPPPGRLIGYLLFWPGLNARAFCFGRATPPLTGPEVSRAVLKTAAGIGLLACASVLVETKGFIAGWMAMVGIALAAHFGFFELLALFWRGRGIDARSLMQAPMRATSVSNLWSRRWNTAFSDLMHLEVFTPLAKRFGSAAALVGVFTVSGLLHETVISVPARGGYGWPTLYFGLQCAAVMVERTKVGRRIGLGRGVVGRLFVLLVAGLPAVMLFPPVFVENVIVPMIRALS